MRRQTKEELSPKNDEFEHTTQPVPRTSKQKNLQHDYKSVAMTILDYESIFSDFDPRPFYSREISVDFLEACKSTLSKVRHNNILLHLLVPTKYYNEELNIMIKERLKDHFDENANELYKELWRYYIKCFLWII